jgi:protein-disulfide isomerase
VVKVQDIKAITNYGVLMTPALVVDGVVKVAGKVPKVEEIKEWIK